MKKLLQKFIQNILRRYATKILDKYHPDIIGITGSVGKTSAKEAIALVLLSEYNVRKNIKNYNNEIGLPLTIIGSESGGKSIAQWLKIFSIAKKIIKESAEYPEALVLEMGADRPGDISYLTKFIKCKVGVVTAVGRSHLEFFETINNIAKEKGRLAESIGLGGYVILNADDERVSTMRSKTKAKVITCGFLGSADLQASDVRIGGGNNGNGNGNGISFKLKYKNNIIPVALPHILGEHFVYAALYAIAVGIVYEIPIISIVNSLKKFESPAGRMKLINGIKNTKIIDDTYNSSLQSAESALRTLKSVSGKKKYAVLGDMLELGAESEKDHKKAGKFVKEFGCDILITVGERSRDTAKSAEGAGMARDFIFSFGNTEEAGKFLQERILEGDVILVKGSQGMRMERIVKEIMAEPLKAPELLVRQGEGWMK